MLAPCLGALFVWLSVAGAIDQPPTVKAWKAVEGNDDLFKSCSYTTRFAFEEFFGPKRSFRKDSVVQNYYYLSSKAQSVQTCTHTQATRRASGCDESPICNIDGRKIDRCPAYPEDYTCPHCDGDQMTERYCARLCTQWFVRKSQHDPLQRYGVVAALREGNQCWCTPFGGARDDDEEDYTKTPQHVFDEYERVEPYACAGDNTTTCGGRINGTDTQLETAVKIYCHSSLTFFFVALAPVACRLLVDGLSGLCAFWRLKCCKRCGGLSGERDQSTEFTMTTLCDSSHRTWNDAIVMNKMTPASALALAGVRWLCHMSQPIIFMVLLYHYASQKDMIGDPQKWLGLVVAVREAIYLLMICQCTYRMPSFLLINVHASVLGITNGDAVKQGGIFLGLIILAPEKFVAQVLFNPGGLDVNSSVNRMSQYPRRQEQARIHRLYFATLGVGFVIDWVAISAIVVGYWEGQLPWSLSVGYLVTAARVLWLASALAHEACRSCGCRTRTRPRSVSDDQNSRLLDESTGA